MFLAGPSSRGLHIFITVLWSVVQSSIVRDIARYVHFVLTSPLLASEYAFSLAEKGSDQSPRATVNYIELFRLRTFRRQHYVHSRLTQRRTTYSCE
jgi:hypothetical protein